MRDIVDRCRGWFIATDSTGKSVRVRSSVAYEAADEIERLRAELDRTHRKADHCCHGFYCPDCDPVRDAMDRTEEHL